MTVTQWFPPDNIVYHPTAEELTELLANPDRVRNKKLRRTSEHRERIRWHLNDVHSGINRLLDMSGEITVPVAKFRTGQKVFQWWAGWFATASAPLMHVSGNSRPAWFDADIVTALGFGTQMYAGRSWTEHLYQVH